MSDSPYRKARRTRRANVQHFSLDNDAFDYHSGRRKQHKTAQLCRQAYQAISLALSGSANDLLRDLFVHAVEPAPDASRLLIRLSLSTTASAPNLADLLTQLHHATPYLRRELARAITRKRAPELAFTFSLSEGGQP